MTLNPASGLRKQDGGTVVRSVSSNPIGVPIAWSWLQTRWNEIIAYFDTSVSSPVGGMVTSVTRSFNTQQELQELQQFYDDNLGNLGSAQRATESAIQTTEANVQWMTDNFDTVVAWIKRHT